MDKITNLDRNKIRVAIADKLVDKICSELIDSKPLTSNLRETLGNTMTNVLNEPQNKSKITQTIFQSIDSALRIPSSGPLLLYSLVTNENTYKYIQKFITTIFSNVYNENDTINVFSKRLYQQLRNPPYETWFSQTQQGGKKRKTLRSKKKLTKNKIQKRKTKRARKYAGGNALAGMAKGFAKKHKGTIEKQVKKIAEEHKDDIEQIAKDNVTEENNVETSVPSKKARDKMSWSERVKDDYSQGKEALSAIGSNLEKNLGKQGVNLPSISMPSMPSMPSFGKEDLPEMSGGEIDQAADDLIVKFGTSLIENITKDIPNISPQILQRMTNASYVHALKNSDQLIDSAKRSIGDTIRITPMIMDVFPIILVQALYNSIDTVTEYLAISLQQQKKDARDQGTDDKIKFKQTEPGFIVIFMEKLKEEISTQIS